MLRKDLWTFGGDRIAVRFQYEWHDADGAWWRSYGNELWEFAADGRCAAARRASTTSRSPSPSGRIFGPRADGDTTSPPLR